MTMTAVDQQIALMEGAAALPRQNGELVFQAPWEGRVFGMAVVLQNADLYPWDAFRDHLIRELAEAERRGDPQSYYEHWLASFEALLIERGLIDPAELEARTEEFRSGARDEVF